MKESKGKPGDKPIPNISRTQVRSLCMHCAGAATHCVHTAISCTARQYGDSKGHRQWCGMLQRAVSSSQGHHNRQ